MHSLMCGNNGYSSKNKSTFFFHIFFCFFFFSVKWKSDLKLVTFSIQSLRGQSGNEIAYSCDVNPNSWQNNCLGH